MVVPSQLPLRLGIQQRILPDYRASFFELLAERFQAGLGVFAGRPLPVEAVVPCDHLEKAVLTQASNYHFLNPSAPFYLCWQRGILDWLEHWRPDVLIVEANSRLLSTYRAIRWMHRRGNPVLGWGLGAPTVTGVLSRLRVWQRNQFLASLDGWVSYSRRGAQEYRQIGLNPERIFVAGNAVTMPPTKPPPPRPESWRGTPVVLYVGRLQSRKRIDNLLFACASLSPELQPRLVVVGDGPERAALHALASQVYPKAVFTGAKRGAELTPFFQEADLFVLPGTGGLAVQQAMANGLPVIVAQGDGTQEDLVRPENGWLIPADDLPALVTALKQALADPVRLRRMGQESYRIVVEEANLQHMADVFVQAVCQVCGLI